jgi:class 3 adenylate cyclase
MKRASTVGGGGETAARDVEADLAAAERRGLKTAVLGRNAVLVVLGLWMLAVGRPPGNVAGALLVALFVVTGFAYLRLMALELERPWHRYVFVAFDVAALAAAALFLPVSFGGDVPQIFVFRGFGVSVLFLVVAGAALTLMPRLVLWTGVAATLGLWVVFLAITLDMERTVSWSDLPPSPSREEYYAVVFDADFVGRGNRVIESLLLLSVAGLLALAVGRARAVARERAWADRQRRRALEVFGQYVPAAVAEALVDRPDQLAPQVREASVVFADVEGFTRLAEGRAPAEVLASLSALFGEIGAIVAREGGVVIGFAGDAVLASFNAPLACRDHPARALAAAAAVADLTLEELRLRVGVATGPVVAGTVGGAERQAFTLYGDTVNVAQRLEAANKAHGTRLLAELRVWRAAGAPAGYRRIGALTVRNRAAAVEAVTPLASATQSGFCEPTK